MKDEGAEALLEVLEENTTLSHLDVQSNKLNICECCCFEKVNLIFLTGNNISDVMKKRLEASWDEDRGYLYV